MPKRSTAVDCNICHTRYDEDDLSKNFAEATKCENLGRPKFKYKVGQKFNALIDHRSALEQFFDFDFSNIPGGLGLSKKLIIRRWQVMSKTVKLVSVHYPRQAPKNMHMPFYTVQAGKIKVEISQADLLIAQTKAIPPIKLVK